MNSRYYSFAISLIFTILLVYILHIGRELLLPLVIAAFLNFIIARFAALIEKIHLGNLKIPYEIAIFSAILISGALLTGFFMLLSDSISKIISQTTAYQEKLKELFSWVNHISNGHLNLNAELTKLNFQKIFSSLALIVSDIAANVSLIIVYLVFMILETRSFRMKIEALCKTRDQLVYIQNIIKRIFDDLANYLKIKTLMNLIAAILSYFVLLGFHVKFSAFWGVLIFLFHFVPYVGPILIIILILVAVSVQVTNWILFILLLLLLSFIAGIIGQFIEPKWMGKRLNLSPLIILLSIAFWGTLWGILGMLLCVPIMVTLNIIFSKFESTRTIAILLSSTGKLKS